MRCFVSRRGFTVIELLIVIAIIGVLVGLLLAAVQGVRERANIVHCANNLRQVGIALHNEHDVQRRFPSGGWGWKWIGMPSRSSGPEQPGGWLYGVLPYIELGRLRTLGAGEDGLRAAESMRSLVATPVALFNCPSRRQGGPFLVQGKVGVYRMGVSSGATLRVRVTEAARADYAGNAGSQGFNQLFSGPSSLSLGDDPGFGWPKNGECNGVFYQRSAISASDLGRGMSNVFLAGERYIEVGHYYDGADFGDNESMYIGFDNDVCRVTCDPPERDRSGYMNPRIFGSAHGAGVNMLYADGAVRMVGYDVDSSVFALTGRRYE